MTRLRVGILAGSVASLSPWEVRLFDKICSDERFELVVVLVEASEPALKSRERRSLAGRAFKFDATRLAGAPAYEGRVFEEPLTTGKVLFVTQAQQAAGIPEAIAAISGMALDVVLVHGLDDVSDQFSAYARFGAWSLRFAGERLDTSAPGQVLACLDQGGLVQVALQAVLLGGADRRVIASAAFNLERSPATTLTRTAEKAVALVWRALERLAQTRQFVFETSKIVSAATVAPAATSGALKTVRYGRAIASLASSKISKTLAQRAGRHHMRWSLLFGEGQFDPKTLAGTHEIVPPKGEFWADPFLLKRDSQTFVFYENYDYAKARGKISVGVYRDRTLQVLGDALDLPYHLSFPFVFEHGGTTYMIPETCAAKRVEVWRAVDFPLRWELFATALEGQSVADPVLLFDDGRWWLFVNISSTPFEDHCNELHVFEVDGPGLQSLTPHALNPVVIGSDTARNAGRIVRRDGKLLRLAQNNSYGVYGYGLNVMEITQLDSANYRETRRVSVSPAFKPGLIGCHHMDQCGDIFVVDGCRRFG